MLTFLFNFVKILFQSDENDDMSITEKKHQLIKDYLFDHFCGTMDYPSCYSTALKNELEEVLSVEVTRQDIEVAIQLVSEDMFYCAECGWTCEINEQSEKDGELVCADCAGE